MPERVEELVAAIQAAENTPGAVVRAVGSGWSYPDVAIAPEVTVAIRTDRLNKVLSGTDPASTATLIPFALNDASRTTPQKFVHVEAGIQVQELNCKLDAMGVALERLGGSNGQSIAGAISTSSHGSQVDMQPIADQVRAIHLVGPGGQEWWIERSGARAITDPLRIQQTRAAGRLCQDIRIVYDDLLFNAVLVSVGRMGIIYSYVVEVVPAFLMRQEKRQTPPWQGTATILLGHRDANPYTGYPFMEVIVDPYSRGCVITIRKPVTNEPPSADLPNAFKFVCDVPAMNLVLSNILAIVPGMIAAATAAAIATVSPALLLIPFAFETASAAAVTLATAEIIALQTAVTAALATPGEDLAQKIASIVNTVVGLGGKAVLPMLVDMLVRTERNPEDPVIVAKSFRLLTGQKACPTMEAPGECLRNVDGFEFALDFSPGSEKLFNFMDDVFALTDEFFASNMPQAYGISLRFVNGTDALIGMQQFSRTCHAEFFFLRGIGGAADFYQRLYAIAKKHDAIPHWGLIHEIDRQEIDRLYGARLAAWRTALRQLIDEGRGRDGTFSTSFSSSRGLEPTLVSPSPWSQLPGLGTDIGVGADGSVWLIGTNFVGVAELDTDIGARADSSVPLIGTNPVGAGSGFGVYRWNGADWSGVDGGGIHIAVGPNGQPWMVNSVGAIFRQENSWGSPLPGRGKDIGVGADGSVWLIGTNPVGDGSDFGVYKWNGTGWDGVDGGGIRIAVGRDGQPWMLNSAGAIFHRQGNSWGSPLPGLGKDIGVGADGSVWLIGTNRIGGGSDFGIYKWNGTGWDGVEHGGGVRIAVGPNGQPWMVNSAGDIFRGL